MNIGVLGAGQLGRMLALAGYPLGFRFRFFDPTPAASAGQLSEQHTGRYDDQAVLDRFAAGLDVVTFEFENVPVEAVRFLETLVPVYPPAEALEVAQDRLTEKSFFRDSGVPTMDFATIDTEHDVSRAIQITGLPAVLKTRRLGYDGKGQAVVQTEGELRDAVLDMSGSGLLLEAFVPFKRELSIISVRDRSGVIISYPLVENVHREGILRRSTAPALNVPVSIQQAAERYASEIMQRLEYVGVLAIEFFEVEDGLLANEMAPRVHNSGHWTIEGSETSQFENHLRAVAGLPLGSTASVGHAVMLNIIGNFPDLAEILAVRGAHAHLYGKEPRAGRKLGHVTVRSNDRDDAIMIANQIATRIDI